MDPLQPDPDRETVALGMCLAGLAAVSMPWQAVVVLMLVAGLAAMVLVALKRTDHANPEEHP